MTRLLCGFALLLGALGCIGNGIAQRELPEDLIAFRYRTPEEGRRRAEEMVKDARQGSQSGPARARPRRGGRNDLVASANDMSKIFGALLGGDSGGRVNGGRLALLDPATLEIEVVRSALRGSVPLAWSPGKQRLLYAQPGEGDFQIFEYDHTAQTSRPVTHGPFSHTQACYGPEGRIAVTRVDARAQPLVTLIALSEPDGRGPYRQITAGPSDHTPACAPDGSAIAFVREPESGRAEIRVLEPVVSGEERRLTRGRHPSFSPSSEWLVFAAPIKRDQRLARIRLDGSGRSRLGEGNLDEARPTVSPDGRFILYVASEVQLRSHLYLRRFDGTGDRILFADGDGEFPVW